MASRHGSTWSQLTLAYQDAWETGDVCTAFRHEATGFRATCSTVWLFHILSAVAVRPPKQINRRSKTLTNIGQKLNNFDRLICFIEGCWTHATERERERERERKKENVFVFFKSEGMTQIKGDAAFDGKGRNNDG